MNYKNIFSVILFICLFQTLQANNVIISTSKDTVCTGADVQFKGNVVGGAVIKWVWNYQYNGSTFLIDSTQNITTSFSNPGDYTISLIVVYNTSVIETQTLSINVIQSATALFSVSGATSGIPQSVNFVNSSTNSVGSVWNFGDNSGTVIQTNPSHIYNIAGVDTVTLIAYGNHLCNDTTTLPLIIGDTAGLTMPNVFSPNGDDINDYFAPKVHGLKTLACTIYDRWGAKIVDLDMSNQQYWDGYTTSGLACSAGTYFYVVKATDVNGKSYSLKGFIQLIR